MKATCSRPPSKTGTSPRHSWRCWYPASYAAARRSRLGPLRLLGETRDDAAGEAFDKVGRCSGWDIRVAPIERLAKEGDPRRFSFPRPMIADGSSSRSPDSRPPCCTRCAHRTISIEIAHTSRVAFRMPSSTCSSPSWTVPCARPGTPPPRLAAESRAAARCRLAPRTAGRGGACRGGEPAAQRRQRRDDRARRLVPPAARRAQRLDARRPRRSSPPRSRNRRDYDMTVYPFVLHLGRSSSRATG